MALRPHAGVRYRFREPGQHEWEEAGWTGYVAAESDDQALEEVQRRRAGCEIVLIEVRWKQM